MSTQTADRRRATARALRVAAALSLALMATSGVADAGVTSPYIRSSVVQLAPGITHERGTMRTAGGRIQAVQIATIDLSEPTVSLQALLSNDTVVRLEPPTRNANRHSTERQVAMVATNGDTSAANEWGAEAGPHSLLVHGGEVWVAPKCSRPTLGVGADGTARLRSMRVFATLDMGKLRSPETWIALMGVNTNRVANETILYTPRFGRSTLTPDNGTGSEVVLDTGGAKVLPSGVIEAKVIQMRLGRGNTRLLPGQMVVSGSGPKKAELALLHVGATVRIQTQVLDGETLPCRPRAKVLTEFWPTVQETMGGNWWDSHNGVVAAPSCSLYGAGCVPAPRTAIGLTRDGRVILAVVDGRQAGYSVGVSLKEMGQLMLSLGAVDATNLDGGGSSVIGIRRPGADRLRVSNRPSHGRERALTMAIVAFSIRPG